MLRAEVEFPSVVAACYFQGRLGDLDKGEIGLRKPGIGRQLDLIRCVAASTHAATDPELTLKLLGELLMAPWYFERRGRIEQVASGGVFGYLGRLRRSGFYRPIYMTVRTFAEPVLNFVQDQHWLVKTVKEAPVSSDLLYRELMDRRLEPQLGGVIPIQQLVTHFREAFKLTATSAVPTVVHDPTGKEVVNTISSDGYENDMAKRLIELASLKRMLIPVRGVPVTALLVARRDDRGLRVFERVLCQGLRLNHEFTMFETLVPHRGEGAYKTWLLH
jgi:hypothetical protein